MNKRWRFVVLAAAIVLASCATTNPDNLKPGMSAEQVRLQMGTERASYPLPNGAKRLEFRGSGANTFMVDFDASGRMVDVTQVLNETNFRNIKAGMSSDLVLATLGQPDERRGVGRQGNQVWSWHFRNTQCLWFQVTIGADGQTTAGGSTSMLPACMNAPS